MNILDKIISHKRQEVDERKSLTPLKVLRNTRYYGTPVVSLKEYILRPDSMGIIAEIKKKSPSEGTINPFVDVQELSVGYMQAGASAISILTDAHFFGGSQDDLETVRNYNYCPVLCKDFIIDTYQIDEAKARGADVILLIARAMSKSECNTLADYAHSIGLEVLLEIHTEEELEFFSSHIDLIGVNSRSLQDFTTDLDRIERLYSQLPTECPRIAESGIHSTEDYLRLKSTGYDGFLIGTHFMKNVDPAGACKQFIDRISSQMITT